MKISNVRIHNFRGIKHADVCFPRDNRLICLVGPGDSGKTTFLTAIEWTLWPTWNLVASDTDFYNCNPENTISIFVTLVELPDALLKEDKFGLFLRNPEAIQPGMDDEPIDGKSVALTIRLCIDATLEPKWDVITNRTDTKPISQNDRRLLSFGVVGFDHEKDFQWGKNSVLQKYADSRDTLHSAFTQAMRNAVNSTSLDALDRMAPVMTEIAGKYGVSFNGSIHNKLLMQNGSYSTTVGVFDGEIPLTQRGLGSRRLLSIGMNINACTDGSLVVVDELEMGLEPHRISTLVNQFRAQFVSSGQLIMTTHSISAVCECTIDEVAVCSNNAGEFAIHYLNTIEGINADVQGLLRANPSAFLSKRIIVCEGKTEVGILRAYEEYLLTKYQARFAHYGVSAVPGGGGDNFFQLAKLLYECGYDVCILMDSDIISEEEQKNEMRTLGIPVFDWEKGNAIEEQLFKDCSIDCVNNMLAVAIQEKSFDHVKAKIQQTINDGDGLFVFSEESVVVQPHISEVQKLALGSIAKAKKAEWYKNIAAGEQIGRIAFSEFDTMETSCFAKQMTALRKWVMGSDS